MQARQADLATGNGGIGHKLRPLGLSTVLSKHQHTMNTLARTLFGTN